MGCWIVKLQGGPKYSNQAAVAIDDKIYSFGSCHCLRDDSNEQDVETFGVHVLNTIDYRWKFVSTTPFVSNPSEQLIDGSGIVYKPYGEIPPLRVGHTVVAYQGKVYLWGGCCPVTRFIYPKMYCFDPVQRTWSVIPSANEPPIPRIKHTAVVYNDTMFIYGGIENDSATNGIILCNNICAYHFETRKWRYIIIYGGISVERFQHTACVIDGKMYVYGGIDAEQWTLCLDVIDLQQGYCQRPVTKGRRPRGIRAACSWVYNNKMYIFGGYRFRSEHYITTLHRFDPKTMVWKRIKPFGLRGPSGRERHCGVVVGDCAYVFGGEFFERINIPSADFPGHWVEMCDLSVLSYNWTLKNLAAIAVLQYQLNLTNSDQLPLDLKIHLDLMTRRNGEL